MKCSGLLLLLVLCLAGCSVTPARYSFETLYPETERVTFHFVTAQEKNGEVVLQGSLYQKHYRLARQNGHVDIVAYGPAGELIEKTTGRYQTPINPPYAWSKTGVRFFAHLSHVPPPGSTIKMAFHLGKSRSTTQDLHDVNIAL